MEAGIATTNDLGRYLGVPALHGRVNSSTYKHILDKLQSKLAGWKAQQLSFAGRLTLIKSVTTAIPTYTMQTAMIPAAICKKLDRCNRNFLWGHVGPAKKPHLVNWRTTCLPKGSGGLGIRPAQAMNKALLAKLNWRFLTEDNSLWVRLLRGKYCKQGPVELCRKSVASHTWRSMVSAKEIVEQGVCWRVGNGKATEFWNTKWLGNIVLKEHALRPLFSNELHMRVGDYWRLNSGWNWPRLQGLLPRDILQQIAPVILREGMEFRDIIAWQGSSNGIFSVKSAFQLCLPHSPVERKHPKWHLIWKLKCPERVKCFIWEVMHEKIMCNFERWKRKMADSSLCQLCGRDVESVIHLLRDCPKATQMWCILIPSSLRTQFFGMELQQWLMWNLKSDIIGGLDEDWSTLFAYGCWWAWKWRNEHVLTGNISSSYNVGLLRNLWLEYKTTVAANRTERTQAPKSEILVGWKPPELAWVKLNTDGASLGNPGIASAGGVLRDHTGRWLRGFALNIGYCSALAAELWGMYRGLNQAWQFGIPNLWLEVDSQVALNAVQNGVPASHPYANLISLCRDLINRDWKVVMSHSYREGNKVADWLANFARSLAPGLHDLAQPPEDVKQLLQHDLRGTSWPRWSRVLATP